MLDPLTPEDWARLTPQLDLLLDSPPGERAARLSELSGGDGLLASLLQRMVAECEREHPLLDRPAAERFGGLFDAPSPRFPEALSDRYRLIRELGRGGMATVFLARDLKHERDVAVKVMRQELALGRERFLHEIRVVAGLRHPHIVPLFDSGDAGGALYYVMPYEEGLSLRARLAHDGPLPVSETAAVLRDVCDALVFAHQHGIVHRDIKPDNVLLSSQHAVVTDFGIAAAITEAGGHAPGTAGGAIGTPAYMAPEQIAGAPDLDHRADIYGLGALAYELLAGRPPFVGDTERVLAAHTSEAPEPLASLRPQVPPALAGAVMRCLAKRPDERWQRAEDLREALDRAMQPAAPRWRRVATAATILALTGVVVALGVRLRSAGSRFGLGGAVPPLSIGILPVDASGATLDRLATGVRNQLPIQLSDVEGLSIQPPENLAPLLARGWALDSVARVRGIDYFVRATLSPAAADSVIVSLELIEGGLRTVRARTLTVPLRGGNVPLLTRDLLEQARPLLGTRVHERQLEGEAGDAGALRHLRRARQYRIVAFQRIQQGDLPGASRALDSAALLLVESQRLDPEWPAPRITRAALSDLRVFVILSESTLQRAQPDLAAIRRVISAAIAIVDSVLARYPADPLALATRGRLQYQRVQLAEPDRRLAVAAIDSARGYLQAALDRDATLTRAATDLAQLLLAEGQAPSAEIAELVESAYRRDAFLESASDLIDFLARSNLELERDSAAVYWCGEGMRRFSGNPAYYACFLDVWAWGSVPSDPDSAWRYHDEVYRRASGASTAGRATRLSTVAAILARSPRVPRDSVRAVLARSRAGVASAPDAGPSARLEQLASEVAVLFRLGDAAAAMRLFRQLQARDADFAAQAATKRRLRGFIPPDSIAVRRQAASAGATIRIPPVGGTRHSRW